MVPLPIDPALPAIVDAACRHGAVVIRAEPGAGKTTRVPPALLPAAATRPAGDVVVLEPRRLAARLAARRVAAEMGEAPGETVGYQVRYEDVTGPRTRLRFVTEGILTRRLAADPALAGVSTVVLDEAHERHIHTDVALALLGRLRRTRRPDLRLVVMSATIDVEPFARLLEAPVVDVPGRTHPIEIEHAPREDRETPLEQRVRDALEALVARDPAGAAGAPEPRAGHVLVFLPGAAEIDRAHGACASLARARGLDLVRLHGSLPADEQDRAVAPGPRGKVILATNVAETSITIDGVAAVIDSGLAKVPAHSPWSGLPTLRLEPVSRASAAQRAGRAGRTGPGRCLRLYTRRDHDTRPAFTPPEIARLDLAEAALAVAAAGVADPAALPWLDPPPQAALAAAQTLLRRLGALDASGRLTPAGERLGRFPVHPRLGRVIVAAEDLGVAGEACALAAELSERDDRAAARARGQLAGLASRRAARPGDPETALERAILAGHPDRVAKRRRPGGDEVLLVEGGCARLAAGSGAGEAPWLVAVDGEERPRGGALVRRATPIEPDWLVDAFPEEVREEVETTWNAAAERVDAASRLVYGALVLDERRGPAPRDGPGGREAEAVLARAALAAGPAAFEDPDALASFLARVAFARTLAPDLPALGDGDVREALASLCAGRRSFADLRAASLLGSLRARLRGDALRTLDRLAPEHVTLARGRRARVRYDPGRPPRVASRLQDFFGMTDGPRAGGGRVPLVLELLAPSGRPVQVTTDLAGFWERHYPAVRRELKRRYPKHAWPQDPLGGG